MCKIDLSEQLDLISLNFIVSLNKSHDHIHKGLSREITGSSGGSSHHTMIFFFFCKNHDFSRFLINFSTVVVVKHTDVVDPKRLTHIHSHRDLNSSEVEIC